MIMIKFSFPCSDEDWRNLCKMRAAFTSESKDEDPGSAIMSENLSDEELAKLDADMERIFYQGHTPMMDNEEKAPPKPRKPCRQDITSIEALTIALIEKFGPLHGNDIKASLIAQRPDMKPERVRQNSMKSKKVHRGVDGIWSLKET